MSNARIESQKILLLSLLWYFQGKGLKAIKLTQGTCKINRFLTANMKVSEDTVTGKVVVSYCNSHSGHDHDIRHLKISTKTKMCIAAKLQSGMSVDRIFVMK